jgi:hypothetical protein
LFRNQTVGLRIEKNGGRLFRRPKLTLSCSAEGKEGIGPTKWNICAPSHLITETDAVSKTLSISNMHHTMEIKVKLSMCLIN